MKYFRVVDQSDLTGPQISILSRLVDHGPMRISRLAKLESISMPTASNMLHQLERTDLVERVPDEQDRRGVVVRLTAAGEAMLDAAAHERERALTKMVEGMPQELLQKLYDATDAFLWIAENFATPGDDSAAK